MRSEALIDTRPQLRGELKLAEPMRRHVSWRAGGSVARAYLPADLDDLAAFLRSLPPEEPVYFVGLGSNLLVRDGGFAGAVVFTHHALTGIQEIKGSDPFIGAAFEVGAGVPAILAKSDEKK